MYVLHSFLLNMKARFDMEDELMNSTEKEDQWSEHLLKAES